MYSISRFAILPTMYGGTIICSDRDRQKHSTEAQERPAFLPKEMPESARKIEKRKIFAALLGRHHKVIVHRGQKTNGFSMRGLIRGRTGNLSREKRTDDEASPVLVAILY